jgi:dGTPase
LAHDIGNPTFGHSEKKRLENIFHWKGKKYKDQLTPKEWQDLIDFEGNANGFFGTEAVPELKADFEFRMQLWCFMKYPKESLPKKPTKRHCW